MDMWVKVPPAKGSVGRESGERKPTAWKVRRQVQDAHGKTKKKIVDLKEEADEDAMDCDAVYAVEAEQLDKFLGAQGFPRRV